MLWFQNFSDNWGNFMWGGNNWSMMGASLFAPFLLWSLFWKGIALWKAAHEKSKGWFVALLFINTAGILEILYIFVFSKNRGFPKF